MGVIQINQKFKSLMVNKTETEFTVGIKELAMDDLPAGDVTVKVAYSSVNYKDGLAAIPTGRIVSTYPFVPGIDLAGTVVSSNDSRLREGDQVIVTSYGLGVSHYGGFSQYARVPADWIVRLPEGLSLKEAMIYGTAGFTAALSIQRLEENGLRPEKGPVLVTGATGGVGSLAISMLAHKGYEVVASTGKEAEHGYLKMIGAQTIINRTELAPEEIRPLGKQRWAGAVDPVGGKTLAYLISTMQYGSSIAVSGLTGGVEVPTTVHPFILRSVNVLGIDSVNCPMDIRTQLWNRMASDLKPKYLLDVHKEITLQELPEALVEILQGKMRGRIVVGLN